MHDNVLEQLYEPFELKARKGVGNQTFQYVPSEDIINRMNRVFKGNWSTQVFQSEIFEDHVLLRVLVTVRDAETQEIYSHEGFASQQIARYTSGPNQGKVIDLGNVYKSAMSKAIKSAVSKWGIGLYLDKKNTSSNPTPSSMPSMPDTNPVMNVPAGPAAGVTNNPNIPVGPSAGAPTNNNPAPMGPTGGAPTGPPMGSPPISTPAFTNDNVVTPNAGPPVESFVGGVEENNGISGVQKQAIKHILDLNSKQYDELAKLALGTDTIPEMDNLDYTQAIKVIQYGNNLSAATS